MKANSVASHVTLLLAAAGVRPAPTVGPALDADVKAVAAILATFDNKYLQLFRRQSDGTLKAWRVAFNTNAPPVAPGRAP